jgi:hypothetical protein
MLSRYPVLPLGLWVQHQLSLMQGLLLGVTGKEVWDMALSSILWAIDIVCGKDVAWPRMFVGKACVSAVGRALDVARQKTKGRELYWEHEYYKTWMWGNTTVRAQSMFCAHFLIEICVIFCLFIWVYFIAFFDIIRDLFMCFLEVCR